MNLNIRRTRQVAFYAGICAAGIALVCSVIAGLPWWIWPVAAAAAYALFYMLVRTLVTRYAINRIIPVYQLLYSKDVVTSRLTKALRQKADDDVVDDIQEGLDQLVALSDNEIERVLQRERERTEFLEAVAHQFKTPVLNIVEYTRTLLDGTKREPDENRQYVERIARSAEGLTLLVGDIEKLADYESGGVVMHMMNFDIAELIYEVFDTNILKAQEKKIRLKLAKKDFSPREKVLVYADRERIGQALDCLVCNGIKYGKEGGTVTVSLLEGYENIAVEVTDNGIGIPGRDLPHLFQKMYRVEKRTGVGLSLAGVKRIVDAHGEHITVRSEVGKGSTFTVTLRKSNLVPYGVH